jgi:gluconokinase
MVIVVMGAAGAGKTTVGRALAQNLGWRFVDADDLHPRENVEKMARDQPLTDEDREPWLRAVGRTISHATETNESMVLACSALKREYRRVLDLPGTRFVYLRASRTLLEQRLAARRRHFAGPGLLGSQLAALEEPRDDEALVLDASEPPGTLVERIRTEFGLAGER